MDKTQRDSNRPDVEAAERGGDWSQPMDGEGRPADANIKEALYWKQVYTDILSMEEKVLARIRQLMTKQSPAGRREVELTNVPVVVAQAERFRQRLGYWEARVEVLRNESDGQLDGQFDGHFDGQFDGQLDGHRDGQPGRRQGKPYKP